MSDTTGRQRYNPATFGQPCLATGPLCDRKIPLTGRVEASWLWYGNGFGGVVVWIAPV